MRYPVLESILANINNLDKLLKEDPSIEWSNVRLLKRFGHSIDHLNKDLYSPSDEIRNLISNLPEIKLDTPSLIGIVWPKAEDTQFYVLNYNNKKFLIDNQGQDFPSKIVELG